MRIFSSPRRRTGSSSGRPSISSRTRARSWYAKCGVAGPTSASMSSFVGSRSMRGNLTTGASVGMYHDRPILPVLREIPHELVVQLREDLLPGAEDDREDHQVKVVEEVVLEEAVDEHRASVNDDVPVELVLELPDRVGEAAVEDGRVLPLGVLERARHHVLRHRVELLSEPLLVGPLGPGRGEALVSDPPEQQCIAVMELLEFVLVLALVRELERPVGVAVALLAAGSLHHAVDRHELGCDHPSHLALPSYWL